MRNKLLKGMLVLLALAPLGIANAVDCCTFCVRDGQSTQICISCSTGGCYTMVQCGHDYNAVACCQYNNCSKEWECGYIYCIPQA